MRGCEIRPPFIPDALAAEFVAPQADDITLLILRYQGNAERA